MCTFYGSIACEYCTLYNVTACLFFILLHRMRPCYISFSFPA
jgi:hypothetical protein